MHLLAKRTRPASVLAGHLSMLCLLVLVNGCKSKPAPKPSMSAANVAAAVVVAREVRISDEFNGRVWATNYVDIRPRVTGYVDRIAYQEGQTVRRGDLLFVIDPRSYKDALDSAKANLEREQLAADFAKVQADRAKTLKQSDAISQEELQNRDSDLSQSGARVRAAEAAVATAQLNLSFTEVRSPIEGRTSRTQLTRGNLAQADQTILTTVASVDPVYVYFDCDEQSYLRFQEHARHGSGISRENPVRVALANESGFPHPGHVDFLDNTVNPSTGTIRARVVLPNPTHSLTPGLFARVQLQSSDLTQAVLVDDKAILTDQDRKYVYVVGQGNTAQRKDITLGSMVDGLRVIKSGLAPQDKVIVDGLQQIYFPGAPVAPKEVTMGTSIQGSNNLAAAGTK
jgi:membrane fusion protein, multidrug efflux system